MAKLRLKALGILLKKVATLAKKYTDLQVSANSVNLFVKATANNGYLKTYIISTAKTLAEVTAQNTIGEIDIPKDFLVKSSKLLTVEDQDGTLMVVKENNVAVAEPYAAPDVVTGAGSWIDLIINNQEGDGTDSHVCVDLSSFIDIYSNGNGIDLNNKVFSIKLNATASGLAVDADGLAIHIDDDNANGLAITADGLKLGLAQASTNHAGGANGAMSATDKEDLDGLVEDMDLDLLTNEELASWFGYDITGTPAEGSDAAAVKTAIEAVSTDSITDGE